MNSQSESSRALLLGYWKKESVETSNMSRTEETLGLCLGLYLRSGDLCRFQRAVKRWGGLDHVGSASGVLMPMWDQGR